MNDDKFVEASKRERYCLKYILPMIKNKIPGYEWTEYITDIYGYDVYDCLLQAYIEGSIKKRYIIEVKVRDTHYDELILETKKIRDLKSKVLDNLTKILYINITPMGTYIFSISDLQKQNKLVKTKIVANRATMASRTDKIEKGVFMLNVSDAKYLDFKFNEADYQKSIKEVVKTNWENKAKKGLFDYLFGNENN
jgi:hypothetical protein